MDAPPDKKLPPSRVPRWLEVIDQPFFRTKRWGRTPLERVRIFEALAAVFVAHDGNVGAVAAAAEASKLLEIHYGTHVSPVTVTQSLYSLRKKIEYQTKKLGTKPEDAEERRAYRDRLAELAVYIFGEDDLGDIRKLVVDSPAPPVRGELAPDKRLPPSRVPGWDELFQLPFFDTVARKRTPRDYVRVYEAVAAASVDNPDGGKMFIASLASASLAAYYNIDISANTVRSMTSNAVSKVATVVKSLKADYADEPAVRAYLARLVELAAYFAPQQDMARIRKLVKGVRPAASRKRKREPEPPRPSPAVRRLVDGSRATVSPGTDAANMQAVATLVMCIRKHAQRARGPVGARVQAMLRATLRDVTALAADTPLE